MSLSRRGFHGLAGAGLVSAVALPGCSGPAASQAGTLRRAINGSPISIDPHAAYDDSGMTVLTDLFEGLLARDAAGEPIPGMAESWSVSDDGIQHRFELRKDAIWSDGKPITARDFVYSWQRLLAPATAAPFSNMVFALRNARAIAGGERGAETLGLRAVGDQTLIVELAKPTPYFLSQLSHYSLAPVPEHAIAEHGTRWTEPGRMISNGAYSLADWERGQTITLERNQHYREKPAIERIEHVISEDRQIEVLRYRSGELDATYELPATQMDWLREKLPEAVRVTPRLMVVFLALNLDDPRLADARVRRALALTLERDIITDRISRGGETPIYGPVPTSLSEGAMYEPDWAKEPREQRLEQARALMQDAGYGPDNPLELDLYYSTNDMDRRVFIAASAMWQEAYVTTNLLNVEPRATADLRRRRAFHMLRIPWVADYPHSYNFLEFLRSDAGGLNFSNYLNPDFDKAIDAGDFAGAEALAMDDWPIIPLYMASTRHLVSPEIEGWIDNALNVHPSRFLAFGDKSA